jgi:hypothetical protein
MEMPGAGGSFAGLKLPRGQHVDPLLEPQDEVVCDKKLWFVPKRALAAKMDLIGMGAGLRARRSRGGFGEAAVFQAREMILKSLVALRRCAPSLVRGRCPRNAPGSGGERGST